MVADIVANLRPGFLLEGLFLDCVFGRCATIWWENGAGDLEGVRSMKTVCLSGRRKRLWWEENIVMLPTSLLKSMVVHGASEDLVRMCNVQESIE